VRLGGQKPGVQVGGFAAGRLPAGLAGLDVIAGRVLGPAAVDLLPDVVKVVALGQRRDDRHRLIPPRPKRKGWQSEAREFVRRNRAVLASRPVWLFSSGPLGTEPTDAQGRDLTVAAEPKELAEFTEVIHPRGHRVFFGVLDPGRLGLGERAIRNLPTVRALLPEGDFRDWAQIED
jgi:Flavodoxin domain